MLPEYFDEDVLGGVMLGGVMLTLTLPSHGPYTTVFLSLARNMRSHRLEVAIESHREWKPDGVPDRVEWGPLEGMTPTLVHRYGERVREYLQEGLLDIRAAQGLRDEVAEDTAAGRVHYDRWGVPARLGAQSPCENRRFK